MSARAPSGPRGARFLLPVILLGFLLSVPAWNPLAGGGAPDPPGPALAFSTNVLVDGGTGNAWSPALAVDAGAGIHVAWSDDRGGYRRIYYSNSTNTGSTWSADLEIGGTAGTANAYDPAIAVDRTGGPYNNSIYVVWREVTAGDSDIYLRRSPDRGLTWQPRARVDAAPAGVISTAPAIAVTAAGELFVAWSDTRNASRLQVFLRRSFDGGATWSQETQVSQTDANNAQPALAAGAGRVFVGWKEMVTSTLVASLWVARTTDSGGSWTATIADTGPSPTDRSVPQVRVAPDGNVHLIWIGYDTSGVPTLRASRSVDGGVSWSPPLRVDDATTGPLTYRTPRLGSAGGDVFAVWADDRNGDTDIWHTTSTDGGATWGDGIAGNDGRVDDTDANAGPADDATEQTYPAVASDGFGVYVAWSDRRAGGNLDLYFSRLLLQRVFVTEFQDSPAGSEVIELAAFAASPISLTGYRIEIDAFALDLGGLGTLASGQHRAVGDPGWSDLVFDIPVPDEGGVIRVIDNNGVVLDTVAYGQRGAVPDPISGESVSRFWTGAKYADAWARTPVPTWRGFNAAPVPVPAPSLVLNEVLFNPVSPVDAFVEVFYLGIPSVNLGGYVIAGDSPFVLPSATVSAADPYFILRATDAPALFGSMDLTGDNVYLHDAAGSLLDMAGWTSPHAAGGSMARVPEGIGGHAGYDDVSSVAEGWRFDQVPSVPLVILRQDQQAFGDLGENVYFRLTVTHKQTIADRIDLIAIPGPDGWNVVLADIVTGAPLEDHDGDSLPDTDLLPPGAVFEFSVRIDIPGSPPVPDNETAQVAAQASLTPLARSTVSLTVGTYPRIEPSAGVDVDPIWVSGSPPQYLQETNLTLTIAGRGSARVRRAPQDVILLLDRSGSLQDGFCPGCFVLLKDASKGYVDNLTNPDQGTVIYFTAAPILKGPLTTNYARIKADIDSETTPLGGTQIGEAIEAANAELTARGNPVHFWAIILFTDGQDNAGGLDPVDQARASAALGARVFTIGLGPSVDETLLRNIATLTGGVYLHADTPQDLYGIYETIGTLIDFLAGYDNDLTDDIPMVEVTLPPHIVIPAKPFIDPFTGSPRPPDYRATTPSGTVLQWNVSVLRLNETWAVRFAVRSSLVGRVDVIANPASRATYQRWDGATVVRPFPDTEVTVLSAAQPTVRYTITRSPLSGNVWVDGAWYGAPAVFDWYPDSNHTITVPSTDPAGPLSRLLFDRWDDGGALSHGFVAGPVNATITAHFWVQHHPDVRLVGTSAAHDVEVRWTAAGVPAAARAFSTWSDWVDEGAPIGIDVLAAGSGPDERWITQEDFTSPPWDAVGAPFSRSVVYFHQYSLRVVTQGLSPLRPASLSATTFGRRAVSPVWAAWNDWVDEATDSGIDGQVSVSGVERYRTEDVTGWRADMPRSVAVRYFHQWLWRISVNGLSDPGVVEVHGTAFARTLRVPASAPWADWVDDSTTLRIDDRYHPGPRERYRAVDPVTWNVIGAGDVTVQYVHEMLPAVLLVGTDDSHTVGVVIATPSSQRRVDGLWGDWTDWVEVGAVLQFDPQTGGIAPRATTDPTAFEVTDPFDATIAYAAPLEVNFKPFLSAVFVAVLVGVGAAVAYRRPIAFLGSRRGNEDSLEALKLRIARDRRKTGLLVSAPFAAVEAAIGIASHFTGLLRVPEGGTWLSLGLVVNSAILGAGVIVQLAARMKGYHARKELAAAEAEAASADPAAPPRDDDQK